MANKTAEESGIGTSEQPSQVAMTWFQLMAQSSFGAWENTSINLTGSLGLFFHCSHVELKAIYYKEGGIRQLSEVSVRHRT